MAGETIVSDDDEMAAIRQLMTHYFDALYEGDTALFAAIFHPQARLYTVARTDAGMADEATVIDIPGYLAIVAGREAPSAAKAVRRDEIVSIDVATPLTAHVRCRERFFNKLFTDELTLLKVAGRWQIVSKVWDFVLAGE